MKENDLIDVSDFAELVNAPDDYLAADVRAQLSNFLPELENLEFQETVAAYQYLEQQI